MDSHEKNFTPSVPAQKMLNVGAIVVLTHFLLYYGIPGVQRYLFPQFSETTFTWVPLTAYGLAFLAIAIAWTFGLAKTNVVGRLARLNWPHRTTRTLAGLWRIYPYIRIGLAAVILGLSAVFAIQGLFFYRYSGASLGQAVSPVVGMLVVLHAWSMADFLLIVLMMLGDRNFGRSPMWRVPTLIIAISWLIAVNGAASAIYGGLFLYLAVLPGAFRNCILVAARGDRQGLDIRKRLIRVEALCLLIAVLFVGWQVGNAVKTISNSTPLPPTISTQADVPTNPVLGNMLTGYAERLLWLPGRLGVSLYSFGVVTDMVERGGYDPLTAWWVIGQNLQFRWSSLLHLPQVQRPEIRSIGQLNYRNIEHPAVQNDRSGASPGLLAAASYLAPRPLDILIVLTYIGFICVAFARATGPNTQSISLVGYVLLTIMAQEFFLNVADYLLIADGGFIFFASFVLLVEAANANRAVKTSVLHPELTAELSATGA